ncbi:DNA alkylation repair protein [Bacillus sp. EAC]|uniref:DNA alkylation repair protein n=1 Tax=Bacillus sp. EAC TaxID=1978338 RepID=UPI00211AB6EC|nr:DNA alkylation repair protein [Bacillus sp. EAC]
MGTYSENLYYFFLEHKNNENRLAMESYMRNKFTFLGIKSPDRAQLLKDFLKLYGDPPNLICVKEIWDFNEREFQYIALALLDRQYKKAEVERIDFYEKLVIEKSWWDTVDTLACRLISFHFLNYPDLINEYANKWVSSENMWLNRVAILFQMKFKGKTDQERLFTYCQKLSKSNEFFIQKAIGWALREYAYINDTAVENFILTTDLAPLSKREGLKNIDKIRRK